MKTIRGGIPGFHVHIFPEALAWKAVNHIDSVVFGTAGACSALHAFLI